MKTTKPISTISYNSVAFLEVKLRELEKAKLLSWWCFIIHKAEVDEKKDHIHLFMMPSKSIETADLKVFFAEIDLSRQDEKKLSIIDVRRSDFVNWFWYCKHDRLYLASKGESRTHHYTDSQFVWSDELIKDELIAESPRPMSQMMLAMQYVAEGYDDFKILRLLHTPLNQIHYARQSINALRQDYLDRGGRLGHTEDLDAFIDVEAHNDDPF